jgi:hypothetical protein
VDALLYLTVWVSLSLFALAEIARDRTVQSWPREVSAAGLALMIVHILIAMGVRHGWQHAAAVAATAQQTNQVYGVEWGWGIYVNYLFVVTWGMAVPGFRGSGVPGFGVPEVPRFWVRTARVFFLVVIANATIVFAVGWRRVLGVAIVGVLLYAWRARTVARRPAL